MADRLKTAGIIAGLGVLVAACAGNPKDFVGTANSLDAYVRDKGYQPLRIPRAKWGPGTVVSFDAAGNENIVMFNDQCVGFSEPTFSSDADTPDVRVSPSSLNNSTFSRDRTIGAEIALEKGISPDVDVSAAFRDQRVREVKVKIGTAKQFVVSDVTTIAKIKAMATSGKDCVAELTKAGNFVIDDVLVVGDSSFTFIGSGNTTIKLDATLLSAINVKPEFAMRYAGSSELPVTTPSIIGYKLYSYAAAPGSAETGLVSRRVTPAEIAALKRGRQ